MSSEMENTFVAKSLPELYLKSKFADIHFAFNGQTEKVPAHKAILAVASSVFEAMFFGLLKETDTVKIVDVDSSAFKEFLQFFYLSKVTLTMRNIEAVMRLVDKYGMMDCLNMCVEFLESHLTNENVIWGLQLAIMLNDNKLKAFCDDKIKYLLSEYFKSRTFLSCNRDVVKHILQLEALCCPEVELFEACVEWAKVSCQSDGLDENDQTVLKKQLGECLHLIRFRAMEGKDICTIMSSHQHKEMFTKDEALDIFCLKSDAIYQSKIFENASRKRISLEWDSSNVLKCLRGTYDRDKKTVVQNLESTWFSTNATVLLGIISIPLIYENYNNRVVNLKFIVSVIEYEEHDFGLSGVNNILFKGTIESTDSYASISLTQPIFVNPKKLYEIRFEPVEKSTNVYHLWTWYSEVKLEETPLIKFHKNPSEKNDRGGLVRELTFNRLPE